MQPINTDEKAQAAWADEVRRFHADARLQVEDPAGQHWQLVAVDPAGSSCYEFKGQASKFWLSGSGASTRWPCSGSLTESLHLRVDERGQLEAWSGSTAVAKIFLPDASPADWCDGLTHVEASKVLDLTALFAHEEAAKLESLDLGGSDVLSDLQPIARLTRLKALYLNSCVIADISPLSSLVELVTLDLTKCYSITDLRSLSGLHQLTVLSLEDCYKISDIGPLDALERLKSLSLFGCSEVSDLTPLAGMDGLTSLGLSLNDATLVPGLRWVGGLTVLTSLQLDLAGERSIDIAPLSTIEQMQELSLHHFGDRLQDLRPLKGLKRLRSLTLEAYWSAGGQASGDGLQDIRPLAGLTDLQSLTIKNCRDLEDIGPLGNLSQIHQLSLEGCRQISDLNALAGMVKIESLDLKHCEAITDLDPLRELISLRMLHLQSCRELKDLKPLVGLTQLTSVDLYGCHSLSDIHPLASLTRLTELDLRATNVKDIRALAKVTDLRTLDLSMCDRLSDVSPLSGLKRLNSLEMHSCERLALVAQLAEIPSLATLSLNMCANIRDADALSGSQSLRSFSYEETATRDSVLLACAMRRGDSDLAGRAAAAAASFELSKSPSQHSRGLVAAVEVLIEQPELGPDVFRDIAAAFKARGEVPIKTWQALLAAIVRAPDPALRPAFEVALADLSLSEAECVLGPALLALADAPSSAREWALDLAQRALAPVTASAGHARDVAPAAAVFFHSRGLTAEVDAWMERGSVAKVPAWRDRVLLALLRRALRMGETLEARRLLGLLQTPEWRDEARGQLSQHLAAMAQFRDAAAELDAIIDRARRTSTASLALSQTPAFAGDPHAGLSLLLALDGNPETLADVLATMVQQAPDCELVRQVALVFAPTQGVDVGMAIGALLEHEAVTDWTPPKLLAGLRSRVLADRKLAHAALARGTVALLQDEGLLDATRAANVTAALLAEAL